MARAQTDDVLDANLPMSAGPRWALGVVGAILAAAGGVAVFLPGTNVAGVPLLVLAGAAFLYVSATGQQLIQVNKDGVVFARVRKLEKVLRDIAMDPEVSEDSRERIVDVAEKNGVSLFAMGSSEFEDDVFRFFEELSSGRNFTVSRPRSSARDMGADMLLRRRAGGPDVPVELKSMVRATGIDRVIRQVKSFGGEAAILVSGAPVPPTALRLAEESGVRVLIWARGNTSREDWLRVLRELELL
jgi:hypothetical protein